MIGSREYGFEIDIESTGTRRTYIGTPGYSDIAIILQYWNDLWKIHSSWETQISTLWITSSMIYNTRFFIFWLKKYFPMDFYRSIRVWFFTQAETNISSREIVECIGITSCLRSRLSDDLTDMILFQISWSKNR